jgi:alkylhydroperoxidase/carboxymuconolactone decarboxylase family protein YurZ
MSKDYVKVAHDVDMGLADVFKAAPGPMRAYGQLVQEATRGGALDARVKELMAVAISISVRCEGCIAYHRVRLSVAPGRDCLQPRVVMPFDPVVTRVSG